MSRTYRKKYIPLRSEDVQESIIKDKAYAEYYIANGEDPNGGRWYSKNYQLKRGCMYVRFDKNVNRDGNKAHGDLDVICSIAVKRIDSKVRQKLSQELRKMKAGSIGWDENVQNANKIRAHERGLRFYDIG